MKPTAVIAIPALNEEAVLAASVETLRSFVDREMGEYDVTIVIADNGSDDATESTGRALASRLPQVEYLRIGERGKGIAVCRAWETHHADIYAFMDADLATDLAALPELFRRIRAGAGLAIGSRFLEGSTVERSGTRRLLSSGYRWLLRRALGVKAGDAPCGFKAASAAVVRDILPSVRNRTWFFDSELIVRAERGGFRVEEVPVIWKEAHPSGRRSKVRIPRLVFEYIREVLRLRREVGGLPRDSGERFESRIICAMTVALILVSSVVPAYAWWVARQHGLEWSGRMTFSPGDLAVYLSSISQASHGAFFLHNQAAIEPFLPVLNPVWYAVGLVSRVFGVRPLTAFHLARIALIPIAVIVFAAALRHFVSDRSARLVALTVLLFGSGVGMYASLAMAPAMQGGVYQWPTDLWVSESNFFSSATYSPHFIASWLLQVLSLFLLSRAFAHRSLRDAALAGISALALLSFHPFYAPTLFAVAAAWFVLWIVRRGYSSRDAAILLLYGAISVPAVAYYAYLILGTANGSFMHDTNVLWTPSWVQVLIGLGGFALLAPFGYAAGTERGGEEALRTQELALWAFVNAVLLYAPISFQRRLMEGLEFPLAALAGLAAIMLFTRLRNMRDFLGTVLRSSSVVVALLIFLPTSFLVVARDLRDVSERDSRVFFSSDESAMLGWLRTSTPRDALMLSSVTTGNDILGWGERRVYAGHWAQTVALDIKMAEIERFFGERSSRARAAFVASNRIAYVIEGPSERALGGTLAGDPSFVSVFSRGGYSVYALRR